MESKIDYIERNLVEGLLAQIDDMSIESYPDDPRSFNLSHPRGAVLVKYQGHNNSKPNGFQQLRTYNYSLFILIRSRRGNDGAYQVIEKIEEEILPSIIIDNTRFISLGANELEFDLEDGVWYYELKILMEMLYLIGEL